MNKGISPEFRKAVKRYSQTREAQMTPNQYKNWDGKKISLCGKVFSKIRNYADLQYAIQEFLMGHLKHSPWHLGPVDEETIPLLNDLREINARGLVTTQGQPGDCNFSEKYGAEFQRGYLSGILSKRLVEPLALALSEYNVVFLEYGNEKKDESLFTRAFLRGMVYPSIPTLLKKLKTYPARRKLIHSDRLSLTQEENLNKEIRFYTNQPLESTDEFDTLGMCVPEEVVDSFKRTHVSVVFVRLPMCQTDLVELVLEGMRKVVPKVLVKTRGMRL